jgi:hypothetical protein
MATASLVPPDLLGSDWVTRDALAKKFGVTPRTLTKWTYAPDGIPHVRIGKRTYYRLEDVRGWVTSRVQWPQRTKRKAA